MSPISSWFLFVSLGFAVASPAEEPVSPFGCSGDVCGFNVNTTDLVAAPCTDHSVLVAYSKSSGATVIQCSKAGDAKSNQIYVFDRAARNTKSLELLGGRFIRPEFLAEAKSRGVPDTFGRIPL